MSFTPVGARVLVDPDPRPEKTLCGLVFPEDCIRDPVMTGTVAKVGPGHIGEDGERVPMDVKPGDRVVFKGYYDPKRGSNFGGQFLVSRDELYAVLE